MKIKFKKLIICATLLRLFSCPAQEIPYYQCFVDASHRYGLPIEVLTAMASVESKFNKNAVNYNTNKTYDFGIMQINSTWLKKLDSYGISKDDLAEPCQNIMVGTWILAQKVNAAGFGWKAIQYYNGSDPKLGYAQKVFAEIEKQNPQILKDDKIVLNLHIPPNLMLPTMSDNLPEIIVNNESSFYTKQTYAQQDAIQTQPIESAPPVRKKTAKFLYVN